MTSLPVELLHEIFSQLVLIQPDDNRIGSTSKPPWSLILPIASASKTFRFFVLELWFWRLYVRDPHDLLEENILFSEIREKWTKELHLVQRLPSDTDTERKPPSWTIQGFKKLTKIRFDWVMPIPGDQYLRISCYNVQATITELDMRGMEWPSPNILGSISNIFPALETLRIEQDSVWCGLCNLCCVPSFAAPCPETITYSGGIGLPIHYARALAPLVKLKRIVITVGCDGAGTTQLASGSQGNENLWSGECDECMANLYEDEEFRKDWLNRKSNHPTRPPLLDSVEWNFYETLQAPPYLSGYDSESEISATEN